MDVIKTNSKKKKVPTFFSCEQWDFCIAVPFSRAPMKFDQLFKIKRKWLSNYQFNQHAQWTKEWMKISFHPLALPKQIDSSFHSLVSLSSWFHSLTSWKRMQMKRKMRESRVGRRKKNKNQKLHKSARE